MFFYREPEEPKKEEEIAAATDYVEYNAADQWSNQIPDGQWNPDTAVAPIPAVPGLGWTADQGT